MVKKMKCVFRLWLEFPEPSWIFTEIAGLRVRIFYDGGQEEVGYVQTYSISNPPSDEEEISVGELSSEEFRQASFSGLSKGVSHSFSLGKIEKLESAAIRDVENSSLSEDSCREILNLLRRE